MRNWIDPQPIHVSDALQDAVGGHPIVVTALARRGVTTPAAARAFLDPTYYTPSPATDLPDVDRSVERICRALHGGEHIVVWGDFDVDGQTGTALLVEALRKLSSKLDAQQPASIRYFVPTRGQGHGIQLPALDMQLKQDVTLLITCDTGVDAFAAVRRASEQDCDVIVTDHHDLPRSLPPALAVVNPKRMSTDHPLSGLPGVGVAYKLVERLFEQLGVDDELESALDLVALGIVADLAIQLADVRFLLQSGLRVLRTSARVGLRALMAQAELRTDGLTEEHIGYQLAPRLNALGRIGDASRGVELLLTQEGARARMLAAEMDGLNYKRRIITNQVTQSALSQIERDPSLLDYRALVLAANGWHPGVLGLVAGRLAEQFLRPAVVLSLERDGTARGSARSVAGCDIHAALKRDSDLLLYFGGHPGAAGLTLDQSNLEPFRKALSRSVEAVWVQESASPGLQIDAYMSLDQLSLGLVRDIERLAPFGPGNPPLQLATLDLRIVEDGIVGREGTHRRLVVADEGGVTQTVLWWQGAAQPLPEGRFDLAYALRAHDYRGDTQLQVEWVDARLRRPITGPPSRSLRRVVDWRMDPNPAPAVAELLQGDVAVWAEGEDRTTADETSGVDRLQLLPSEALVIWTAPPGPAELAQVLRVVDPDTVYVIAVEPPTAGWRPFLDRLVGMVKHDLRTRDGTVNVPRLAAVLGHREDTVRAGLDLLMARGLLRIVSSKRDTLTLRTGGEPVLGLQDFESRLLRLLDETAAYRRHFQLAALKTLGISAEA